MPPGKVNSAPAPAVPALDPTTAPATTSAISAFGNGATGALPSLAQSENLLAQAGGQEIAFAAQETQDQIEIQAALTALNDLKDDANKL